MITEETDIRHYGFSVHAGELIDYTDAQVAALARLVQDAVMRDRNTLLCSIEGHLPDHRATYEGVALCSRCVKAL